VLQKLHPRAAKYGVMSVHAIVSSRTHSVTKRSDHASR
jgi:hypothetical protein